LPKREMQNMCERTEAEAQLAHLAFAHELLGEHVPGLEGDV
jgi:hypothetical protein